MNFFEVQQFNTTLEMSKLVSDIKSCFEESRGPLMVFERRGSAKHPIVVRDHKGHCRYPEPHRFNGDWHRLQRDIMNERKLENRK